MRAELELFSDDLFGIARRLQSIDEGYVPAYNRRLKRFEVHNLQQRGDTLAAVLPFKRLDARAVEYIRYTSVERKKQILADIERHNEKKERESLKKSLDTVLAESEEELFARS